MPALEGHVESAVRLCGDCLGDTRYLFDEFELDRDRYELRRSGAAQHLEPLVFDLLWFFASHSGRVVSRDEIIEAVWQGRAVSDATVSSGIKSVRRALGDNGDSQHYVRTVRGRGFEFTARVTRRNGEATAPTEPRAARPGECEVPCAPPAAAGIESGRPPDRDARLNQRPVLAVLPFSNLSADVDEYFADGLTEDIITNLSRFHDLSVIAGASTFRFKAQAVDLLAVRAQLHADYIVQGSVRRAAGRVRIAVQLVDGASGVQLWGDRYDRELGDIFELQDEVTRTMAATLGVQVQGVALQRALTKKPQELQAYECLLRARHYTTTLSAEAHAEARDLLEKAVELDPFSADAHALLANVCLGEYRFDWNPRPNAIGRALVHALAAIQLDPQHAYARCWLAIVHFFRGETEKFETEAKLAIKLNPNDPEVLADIGHYLAFLGQFERGVALSRRAQQLNPFHPGWYWFSFARLHYHQREYGLTIADAERVGMPHFYWTHLLTAAAKGQLRHADARASLDRLFAIKPDFSAVAELKKWNAEPKDFEHLMDGLRKAGLKE